MPAYTYRCGGCGTEQEQRLHIADTHPTTVPCRCGGDARKRYAAAPVVFRGGGFYSTDNR